MLGPEEHSIELVAGTPIADAVTRGSEAFTRGDVKGGDDAYRQATSLAADDPGLWQALAVDHIAGLLDLEAVTLALRRGDEYLREADTPHLRGTAICIQLLRAEIRSSVGDHSGIDAEVAAIRGALVSRPNALTPHEHAVLQRLEGLFAAEQGDVDKAVDHLRVARQMLDEMGNQRGMETIDRDIHTIKVRHGDDDAVSEVLAGLPPQTVSDHLLHVRALTHRFRYEEALGVLQRALDRDRDLDPALCFPLRYEQAVLLQLIRDDEAVERLLPSLQQAAARSPNPRASAEAVARVSTTGVFGGAVSPTFDAKLQHARRLILGGRLDEAQRLLDDLRERARTDRDLAAWYLAAGELSPARSKLPGSNLFAKHAVTFLRKAVDYAAVQESLIEVRVLALRLLGRAHARLSAYDPAVGYWADAHGLEERIAWRQGTDEVRIRMLHAIPDEHDEQIRAAAEAREELVAAEAPKEYIAAATAAVAVAMEAARGAAILERILPGKAALVRDLPRPSDQAGAWRWVDHIASGLLSDQVAWLLHATPDPGRVHHAVIGRGFFHYASVTSNYEELRKAIDTLAACWEGEDRLEATIRDGSFGRCLAEIASRIGVNAVIPDLPPHVRRIAVVAGGMLSDIPFAAVQNPGDAEPLGLRFALSDLPCLSALLPLRRRSRRIRGDKRLLISPSAQWAVPAALEAALKHRRYRQVRIDCHGRHDPADPSKSWLQLAPDAPDGRLEAGRLETMDLRGCGMLVLGACESGMAQRTGRDERTGFVRAGLRAGTASVVAARWVAKDAVAAAVLDGFDRYTRYLPRDIALQRAQLDVCHGITPTSAPVSAVDHPARWACWTLYGDSGFQTRAGRIRRSLRRSMDGWRRHAARR